MGYVHSVHLVSSCVYFFYPTLPSVKFCELYMLKEGASKGVATHSPSALNFCIQRRVVVCESCSLHPQMKP